MTLQEVLDEISEKYPHGLTNDSVIRKINFLQGELFRTICRETTTSYLDLIKDQGLYPIDIQKANLIDVLVDGDSYPYSEINSNAHSKFYYVIDGQIGIYPLPKEDKTQGLLVVHYKNPDKLTTGDLNKEPDFDTDFHKLLVYGVIIDIAENYRDADMVNAFTSKYNGLLDEYLLAKQEPEYSTIREVYW